MFALFLCWRKDFIYFGESFREALVLRRVLKLVNKLKYGFVGGFCSYEMMHFPGISRPYSSDGM